jgi:hypothetical protein
MYDFGSKYEGLVFAKIEVKGLWLFLYRVTSRPLSWKKPKTDESLTLLSQFSVHSQSGIILPQGNLRAASSSPQNTFLLSPSI